MQRKEVPQLPESPICVLGLKIVLCVCMHMCACVHGYVYVVGRQLSQWKWASGHLHQSPCSWILNAEGFWELALGAGRRAAWEIVGTGENRLEGCGSCWNVWTEQPHLHSSRNGSWLGSQHGAFPELSPAPLSQAP